MAREGNDGRQDLELYLGGELVPPGHYRRMGFSETFHLGQKHYLPASLDGRVAVYLRIDVTGEDRQSTNQRPTDG